MDEQNFGWSARFPLSQEPGVPNFGGIENYEVTGGDQRWELRERGVDYR
jgi:hypothetical protein